MSRPSVFDLSSQSHFQQILSRTSRNNWTLLLLLLGTTNDTLHRRRRFSFFCSFALHTSLSPSSSGMEIYHSLPIFEKHTASCYAELFWWLSTRSRISINNKNPTKIYPQIPISRRSSQFGEITTHRLGIFLKQSGCKRTTILLSSFHFRRELGQHWGK